MSTDKLIHKPTTGRYIGDFVYGANDGIITTFAVVAGTVGASLAAPIIVILGFANLFADGISMGASNFLGKRSEHEFAKKKRQQEYRDIKERKEEEIEELRHIFGQKGFTGKELERVIATITSNEKVWVDTIMREAIGIMDDSKDKPLRHGLATFVAFVIAGFFPLIPYLLPNFPSPFLVSCIIGALTLFVVGALRSLITAITWFRGGIEMLLVGSSASLIAYIVGAFVERIVSSM